MKPPNEEDDDYDEIAARLKHRAAAAYTEEQICTIKSGKKLLQGRNAEYERSG